MVASLVLGGCASIPRAGPVTEVVDDSGLGQSTVRYSPALPADDASPNDIVRGYLDAMLAYPASTRTASAFLTPAAADGWRPQAGVVVYDGARVAQPADDGARRAEGEASDAVVVTVDEVGRISSAGRYQTGRGGRAITFHLERVDEQWRISDPPDGLLVTAKFFDDYYRAFSVYFFDGPAQRLVATPVHLPVDDRLAAALVASLARGPGDDQLRTFVPAAEDLRSTVPVTDGVADVGFSGVDRDELDVDRLSAQVTQTLSQVPSLDGVRVTVDDRQLGGADVLTPTTTGDVYGIGASLNRAYGLRAGRVVRLVDDEVSPIEGPWGKDTGNARAVAVGNGAVALLDRSRGSVRIAGTDGKVRATVRGEAFMAPVVDADGRFWLVDRPGGRTRVRVVDGASVAPVSTAGLADLRLTSFDVSPDGARYLAGVGGGTSATILTGMVQRSGKDAITGLTEPGEPNDDVRGRSPVWIGGTEIAFLGSGRSGVELQTMLVDGSPGDTSGGRVVLPDGDSQGLAVASSGTDQSYLTMDDGRVCHLGVGGIWRTISSEDPITSIGFGP